MTSRILGSQKGEIAKGCNKCHEEPHGLFSSLKFLRGSNQGE